ncbi:hypothetical protein GH714_005431 [Hevea brasiliensis]|uniref:Lipocalin/cytosolic fatty-acid binding domain-containing protein n=1 Tax=Hevea brasiliensis TaxID=3981 RepID=A0A6A6M813_HEVBR|nr:hypothetical protein GH714_005431 [Hevea brasiliensis]
MASKKEMEVVKGVDLKRIWVLQILCRRTHLDDEIYKQLVEKAKEKGYDVSKLHKTPQTDPPPEGEDGPKDTKGIWWIKSILGSKYCMKLELNLALMELDFVRGKAVRVKRFQFGMRA